ncbi:MAG: DUF1353 domain-containing protein [Campylobacteraceae bacterium]|jgi:hypothetical protein|nr:DUF1353 domain-containing protein [Campylobacteraceae bacterium]
MGVFSLIAGFFINWFSKPKKQLVSAPIIRPVGGKNSALYEVVEDFTINGYTVKKGTKTDGGSIPLIFCSILGVHPFSPSIIAACIGHDDQYDNVIRFYEETKRVKNRAGRQGALEAFKQADNWFYDALQLNNRRVRCKLFFWAVRAYSTLKFGFWEWYIAPIFNKEK